MSSNKKRKLADADIETTPTRQPLQEVTLNVPAPKTPTKNVGGASKLLWYNILVDDPRLSDVRSNLYGKIAKQVSFLIGYFVRRWVNSK
jgi:hypothetical protein